MSRLIRLMVAAVCILSGAVVGAFNPQKVVLDMGFVSVTTSLGLCVLLALLLGVLLGGALITMGLVLPLRRRLNRMQANSQVQPSNTET